MAKAVTKLNAYCYRSGQIGFCRGRVPEGTIRFARAPATILRRAVMGSARLAYDNKTWLVPGLPEAETEDEALSALRRYTDWLKGSIAFREREAADA